MSSIYPYARLEHGSVVYQSSENTYRSRSRVDVIPIKVQRWKAYANYNPETHQYDKVEPIVQATNTLKLRFSREKASGDAKTTMERFARYKRIIDGSPREANKLRDKLRRYVYNKVGVAENQHPFIIDHIFNVLLREAVPDKIIEVRTVNIIYRYTEERHLELLSEDADYLYKAKLIPSTESFIEALEEAATPPDDELHCAICMEMFALRKDSSITQLPCSHYYHRDCIAPWLQINHVCPTCRHPNAPFRPGS
ncbi:PREDICTED: E3 ubiquitin-protein ligase Praja-2-like [Fragaria vesca subsp. vesca]